MSEGLMKQNYYLTHTHHISCGQKLVVIRFRQFHTREQIRYNPLEERNIWSKELQGKRENIM